MTYYPDGCTSHQYGHPYSSFIDAPHRDNLMSPPFPYLDPNQGLWQMNGMLPQLTDTVKSLSDDGYAPSASSDHNLPSAVDGMVPPCANYPAHGAPSSRNYLSPAQPFACPRTSAPYTTNTIDGTTPFSHSSELYLCKTCCAAVLSLVSDGTTIHLVHDACTICHGTSLSPIANDEGNEPSCCHSLTSDIHAQTPSTSRRLPRNTRNKVAKQKHERLRSTNQHPPQEKGGPFHCQHEGCNRGPGGKPFARKDNKNTHERTVHGAGTQGVLEREAD